MQCNWPIANIISILEVQSISHVVSITAVSITPMLNRLADDIYVNIEIIDHSKL